jgi:hypothetical protein
MEDKKKKYSAKNGNLVLIFVMSLIGFTVLASFAIDSSFFVLTRFKLQKATETTAMAAASYLNEGNAQTKTQEFFKLFQSKGSELEHAEVVSVTEGKVSIDGNQYPAVGIETEVNAPTYFLRMLGLSYIKFKAHAYAVSKTVAYNQVSGDTIELGDILTDKNGPDFSVGIDNGYFIFGGVKDGDDNVMWQDLGCKALVGSTPTLVGSKEYKLVCANSSFDLSQTCVNDTQAEALNL